MSYSEGTLIRDLSYDHKEHVIKLIEFSFECKVEVSIHRKIWRFVPTGKGGKTVGVTDLQTVKEARSAAKTLYHA